MKWDTIEQIFNDYLNRIDSLQPVATAISELVRSNSTVHAVKYRLKNPLHLVEKIIRKTETSDNDWRSITVDNYRTFVKDIIGIRALHLFKEEWISIHKYLEQLCEIEEGPVAHIASDDLDEVEEEFRKNECTIEYHDQGYRSIHDIIKFNLPNDSLYAEIQIRTLYEEAWSEIDHTIRYPHLTDNEYLNHASTILSGITEQADHFSSCLKPLSAILNIKRSGDSDSKEQAKEHFSQYRKHSKLAELVMAKVEVRTADTTAFLVTTEKSLE